MSASPAPAPYVDSGRLTVPGAFRRLAAGFYDALIMLAIFILATFLVMPFSHSHTLDSFYARHVGLKLIYQLGLLALGYAFFGGFWTHGGQTIGMRTWKLRVLCMDYTALGWHRALIRYLTMLIPWLLILLGAEFLMRASQSDMMIYAVAATLIFLLAIAAFIWPTFDPQHLAWHDHLSGTRLVLLPKTRKLKAPDSTVNEQRKNGE